MPNLTKTRLSQISDLLDESFFTSAGFLVETFDDVDKLVCITFQDNTKYFIKLQYETRTIDNVFLALTSSLHGDSTKTFRVLMIEQSPGDFIEIERKDVESFAQFLEEVRLWTERIKNECLIVQLFQKRFEQFQVELNKRLDEHFEDGNSHFSGDERLDLYEKLNQLQERIAELEKERTLTTSELDEIQEVIKDLQRATHIMSKRSWFRTACSKFYSLSIRALSSKIGQNLLEGVSDRLLDSAK